MNYSRRWIKLFIIQQSLQEKKHPDRESYFERYASPRQLDTETKDFVYSWVCNQPIVHQDYLDDFPQKSQFVGGGEKSKDENKNHDAEQKPRSCIFPPIDSSIISGRPVTLIQSEIHNPKPPTKEKPSSGSAHQRRNRNINNNNDQSSNNARNKSNSAPNPLQRTKPIDEKWTDMVYR